MSEHLDNDNWEDRWTCPSCGHDFEGTYDDDVILCPSGCKTKLKLTVIQKPSCRTEIYDPEKDDIE